MVDVSRSIPQSVRALALIPPVLFAAGVLWLLFNWSDLPAHWPVHYGPHGLPDRWVSKSVSAAASPLAIGVLLWALLELVGVLLLKSQEPPPGTTQLTVAGIRLIRLLSAAMAVLCVVLTIALPQVVRLGWWFALPMIGIVGALGWGLAGIQAALRAVRAQFPELYRGYNALYYANKADARLWVPKIAGVGYTLNFAHRASWLILLALLALPLTLVGVAIMSASMGH